MHKIASIFRRKISRGSNPDSPLERASWPHPFRRMLGVSLRCFPLRKARTTAERDCRIDGDASFLCEAGAGLSFQRLRLHRMTPEARRKGNLEPNHCFGLSEPLMSHSQLNQGGNGEK